MLTARPGGRSERSQGALDTDVAVIGAGPHGLSAAVHLRRAGVAVQVFGDPMSFWRTMPRGMLLRSNLSASNMVEPKGPLSLTGYGAAIGATFEAPVGLEDFVAYGDWIQARALPDLDRRMVTELERVGQAFRLALSDGEVLRAGRVVVAAGISAFEHVPSGFGNLGARHVSHSARHRDPSAMRGKRVTVVGGGQSACELAVLLSEMGAVQVEVLARAPALVWLRGHSVKRRLGRLGPILYAPTDVGPLWYSRLVERPGLFGCLPRPAQDRIAARSIRPACAHFVRTRLDRVRLTTGVEVREARAVADEVELVLSDASRRRSDHVILATGYRVDVRRYPFLGESLRRSLHIVDGFPALAPGLESSVPGLHFTGAPAAWSFGPIMRFVSGSWYAGRALSESLTGARRGVR